MPSPAEASPADLLHPLPWHPGHEPAGPPPADPTAPPLLLLLDRRWPIDPDIQRRLAASLAEAEQQRFSAYRLAADRERFLLGRGGLRRILGLWLGLAPEAVHLETGPHGKPHCPGGPAFNLSHSGELILLAVHASRPVGVDVERLRPALDWRAIAGRMLPERERRALEALPEAERPEAFLAAWCRLEARLKACGDGLAGLERLRGQDDLTHGAARNGTEAAALPGDPDRRIGGSAAPREQLWDVAVPTGYRAAVALAPQPAS